MRKNTAKVTATTFTLADQHPNFDAMDAEMLDEVSRPYVWKDEAGARDAVERLVEVNGFEYTRHTAPGLEVYAFYVDGSVLTVIVFEDTTAARLHTAVRRERPVTVTYVKADGEETVRTIEPRSLRTTKAGDVIVKALDRKSGEHRSFRLDRVLSWTVHRSRFTVPEPVKAVPAEPEKALPWTHIYDVTPGTPAALEAPEHVQDEMAAQYALGRRYAFVTI
jgi:hypothetical protein